MIRRLPDNDEVADLLERIADLLAAQGANGWRVRAWRVAAGTVRTLDRSVAALAGAEGLPGLVKLPGIGKSIGSAVREYVETGRLGLLDRLEGQVPPEGLFTTVPGIGEDLARRIHQELEIETLEELEVAAHDGRLDRVPGFGPRRVRAVRDALDAVLSRSGRRRARRALYREGGEAGPIPEPPVETILAVDETYRRRAADGTLRTIAPRRFNPEGASWLPVLHVERDGWDLTAMYSNSARAHELGMTREWVVVWFERGAHEGRHTVVTERRGPLSGRRVVRGREPACLAYYAPPADVP